MAAETGRPEDIESLIGDFSSRDGAVRVKARQALVDIGAGAVEPLVRALAARRTQVRWEAAKALGEIADPAASEALAGALRDSVFDVRWLAAVGLIAIGGQALVPLLRSLIAGADSNLCRDGAHHVLHDLARDDDALRETVAPVLAALEGAEPSVEVPLVAETVVGELLGRSS